MIFYLCTSLPVVAVFTFSEYVRFVSMNTVTHWRGKILGLSAAFIGDSITAGGRCWGTKIGDDPFAAINLGADGSTVRQIKAQLNRAARYKPHTLFILAGTNDILAQGSEFDIEQFERDYRELLVFAATNAQIVVVTLIPFTSSSGHSMPIDRANAVILELCLEQKVRCVDLNPELAPEGVLLPQFTVDGVHFSRAAYQIWSGLLKSAAKPAQAQQDSLANWGRPIYRQPNLSALTADFKK